MTAYVFQAYPKWKYHPSGEARVVKNEGEEVKLGPWWFDTPLERDTAITVALSEVVQAQAEPSAVEAPKTRPRPRKTVTPALD